MKFTGYWLSAFFPPRYFNRHCDAPADYINYVASYTDQSPVEEYIISLSLLIPLSLIAIALTAWAAYLLTWELRRADMALNQQWLVLNRQVGDLFYLFNGIGALICEAAGADDSIIAAAFAAGQFIGVWASYTSYVSTNLLICIAMYDTTTYCTVTMSRCAKKIIPISWATFVFLLGVAVGVELATDDPTVKTVVTYATGVLFVTPIFITLATFVAAARRSHPPRMVCPWCICQMKALLWRSARGAATLMAFHLLPTVGIIVYLVVNVDAGRCLLLEHYLAASRVSQLLVFLFIARIIMDGVLDRWLAKADEELWQALELEKNDP